MAKKQNNSQAKVSWVWVILGGAVLIVIVGALLLRQAQPAAELPAEISVEEAYQKYQAGSFLLDVRTVEEWNEVHVPNATLVPLDQLESRLSEVPQGKEILVICRSGNRSKTGREILLENGFDQVTSVQGGVKEWQAAGYPVEEGAP
jgi:rhodanese-related sulfurtransferase